MEPSLKCNYPKCKISIDDMGCVTTCSHIFCKTHKLTVEVMGRNCPACDSVLDSNYSVVFREVNPTEEWKSNILVGYNPEMIFEAMSKALQFWSFQMNTQLLFRSRGNEYLRTRLAQAENHLETMQLNINQYVQEQTQKVNFHKNEVLSLTKTIQELEGIINEKNRQLSNLQSRYESLRKQTMVCMISQEPEPMDLELSNFDQRKSYINQEAAPPTPRFVFKPNSLNTPHSTFSVSQSTPRQVLLS